MRLINYTDHLASKWACLCTWGSRIATHPLLFTTYDTGYTKRLGRTPLLVPLHCNAYVLGILGVSDCRI